MFLFSNYFAGKRTLDKAFLNVKNHFIISDYMMAKKGTPFVPNMGNSA
jgi:hypothetical protein